jgi:hypothetical protein
MSDADVAVNKIDVWLGTTEVLAAVVIGSTGFISCPSPSPSAVCCRYAPSAFASCSSPACGDVSSSSN